LAQVQVVLVRPRSPANVGAAARAVSNGGLGGLVLVEPGDWRTVECWRTAWGAHEVLERARVVAGLEEALAGSSYVAAFSGRGSGEAPALDVREMAERIAALGDDGRASLVFGPETFGLTRDEIALCGRQVSIPAHADQPSLNLSQAVMVAAYEVFRAGRRRVDPPPRWASHDEKERALALLRDGLRSVHALPAANAEGTFRDWRSLVQRADLTPREVKLLEHMARKMVRAGAARDG
jgi:tRNA/rRNA methyltransferase